MEPVIKTIPSQNRFLVENKINELKSRADRLGIPFPMITVSDLRINPKTRKYCEQHDISYDFIFDVVMSGEGINKPVSYGGWEVIARVDHCYEEALVSRLSDDIDPILLERLTSNNRSHCDHCHKNIKRNNTYILKEVTTDKQISVGGSCLTQYVSCQKTLEQSIDFYINVRDVYFSDSEFEGYQFNNPNTLQIPSLVSKSLALCMIGVTPKDDKFHYYLRMWETPNEFKKTHSEIFDKLSRYRRDASTEHEGILWFVENVLDHNNEFDNKLKILYKAGYCHPRYKSIILWLGKKYYDFLFYEDESWADSFVGEEGGCVDEIVILKGKRYLGWDNYGNERVVFTFQNMAGNNLTWFTEDKDIQIGERYTAKGKIKGHATYKGIKQTIVTRLRLSKKEP